MLLPEISIVVPLFNESEGIALLYDRLNKVIETSEHSIEAVLVNDGSRDNTEELIQQIALLNPKFVSVSLAKNYGHQIALSAGLNVARGTKAIFIIDGDLQDPPELLESFYKQMQNGYDVVYAIRKTRKEGYFKKLAYKIFYRILKKISYINIPLDSGDFSLISRRVIDILNKMPEESRYIRGMRSWIGFNQIGIEYDRQGRAAGESKYSFKQLFNLAYNGIFNFSEFPIKFVSLIGFSAISVSCVYLIITIIKKIFFQGVPEGFTALLFTIILFSGVQLISIGIIGEYVLRIFFQVKNRPLFIIKNRVMDKEFINE